MLAVPVPRPRLDDLPLTLALARCYGRINSVGRVDDLISDKTVIWQTPPDVPQKMKEIGATLIAVASQERGEPVVLATLVPQSFDEAGQIVSTGAPAEIYDSYVRGMSDIASNFHAHSTPKTGRDRAALLHSSLPDVLGPCEALRASIAANRNIGAPREPVYGAGTDPFLKGLPRVLALARCLGRFSYMRIDYNSAARNDKQGSDYPKGFLDDWNRLTQLLTDAARRDRAMVLTISDTPALWDFPPVIADAVRAGADDGYDIDFRPDFWSLPTDYEIQAIDFGSKQDRAACQGVMQAVSRS